MLKWILIAAAVAALAIGLGLGFAGQEQRAGTAPQAALADGGARITLTKLPADDQPAAGMSIRLEKLPASSEPARN